MATAPMGMSRHHMGVPHDRKVAMVTLAALIAATAIVVFLVMMLAHSTMAY